MKVAAILSTLAFLASFANGAPASALALSEDEKALEALIAAGTKKPLLAVDYDANSTVNGHKVNSTFAYGWGMVYTPEQRKKIVELDFKIKSAKTAPDSSLEKRQFWDAKGCENGPAWGQQWQLHQAKLRACERHRDEDMMIIFEDYFYWNGGWSHIQNRHGQNVRVQWRHWFGDFGFDWNMCHDMYLDIINRCRGTNPDSSGGYWVKQLITSYEHYSAAFYVTF